MIFLGDIHGHFNVITDFIDKYSIKNTNFIQVGDFGAFQHLLDEIVDLDNYLKLTNNKLYVARGNHDDPLFWDNNEWYDEDRKFKSKCLDIIFDNIYFIDNYWLTIENKTVLFYGGSYSIDKYQRTINLSYFTNELPDISFLLQLEYSKQELKDNFLGVDIVVTHSAPSIYRPMVYPELPDRVLTEHLLNRLHAMFPTQQWFCGHYHVSHIQDNFRCLDINEFYDLI